MLVVEDDAALAETLAQVLGASGYDVLTAPTGHDACATLQRAQPDLILLDLMLPDTDGLLTMLALKTLTDAPIVICSARSDHVDRSLSQRLGAVDFISKPFELDDLKTRIEAALQRRRN